MPLHEWMVWPLICVAAMPVDAVTATFAPSARASRTNWLSTYVLPAPGAPVRNTFAPAFRMTSASDCRISLLGPQVRSYLFRMLVATMSSAMALDAASSGPGAGAMNALR